MHIVTPARMREIEGYAIGQLGIDGLILMERAALSLAQDLLRGRGGHLQADSGQLAAALEQVGHDLAVIDIMVHHALFYINVGVAGDADERAVERLIGAEAAVQAGEDDVLEQNVGVGAGGRGDFDHAVHRGGNLDKAQQALLVGDAVQATSQIERAVAQVGEGMARIDDQRRDDRRYVGLEVAGYKGMFLGRKRIDAGAVNAQSVELVLDALKDRLPAGKEPGQLCHDSIDLFGGGHIALVVDGLFFELCQIGQAAHAHHEKLVEV